jgi:hypothetical protein
LDDVLIKINREEFFKQFLHPDLKAISNNDDFIDLEKGESTTSMLLDEQIIKISKNVEEAENVNENEVQEEVKIPSTKEAIIALNILSVYMENSKSYNDSQWGLLQNLNDCILQISEEKLKQKNIFDFFKIN